MKKVWIQKEPVDYKFSNCIHCGEPWKVRMYYDDGDPFKNIKYEYNGFKILRMVDEIAGDDYITYHNIHECVKCLGLKTENITVMKEEKLDNFIKKMDDKK